MAVIDFTRPSGKAEHLIYYADVKMNREIFANEWDKKFFLDALGEVRPLFRAEIYGFCVLDDHLSLLVGGHDMKKHTVRRMLTSALERFDRETDCIGEKETIPGDTEIKANIIRIDAKRDAVNVLRYIHLIPVSERYTVSAHYYWWTSYSTYKGYYNWTLVDTSMIMSYLTASFERPAYELMEYHRRGEVLRNPIPACIDNKGEEEVIPLWDDYYTQGNINERFIVHG